MTLVDLELRPVAATPSPAPLPCPGSGSPAPWRATAAAVCRTCEASVALVADPAGWGGAVLDEHLAVVS
jgi:hypothetical protein